VRRDPIETVQFSTAAYPPDERYTAWLNWGWPRSGAIYQTDPTEPFDTEWESAELGDVILVRTAITGMRWKRRLGDIRQSDFDPLIVNMMVEGSARGVFDGRDFREEAGSFHFHDITRPSIHVSTASRTYSLVLPRPLATRLFGSLDDLHGLVVSGAHAELLIAHAENTWRVLSKLDRSSAPALGRSFVDLLVAATSDARSSTPAPAAASTKLRHRAIAAIDSRLNTPITPDDICNVLAVPRKSLFAAFRADGGVQNYVRATRLERAKAAIADIDRDEPIGTIALRLGFCDASHLSRLFKSRFGMTPREYRRLLATDADDRGMAHNQPMISGTSIATPKS